MYISPFIHFIYQFVFFFRVFSFCLFVDWTEMIFQVLASSSHPVPSLTPSPPPPLPSDPTDSFNHHVCSEICRLSTGDRCNR